MATNRYTNLSTSSFNPLSLQEIMMVPMAREQQHQEQQAQVDAMGISLNRLDVDDPYYQERVGAIKSQQDKYTDELMNKGTSRALTRNLMNLSRERQDFLDNDGKKIEANYKQRNANVEAVTKNKDLTEIQKRLGLSKALNDYSGVQKGGNYNDYNGAKYVNIEDRLLELADEMEPEKLAELSGWRKTNRQGQDMWVKGTRTTEKLPMEDIYQAILPMAMNDEHIKDYLREASSLGIINDIPSYMHNTALNAARMKEINNVNTRNEDIKLIDDDEGDDNGLNSTSFNYVPSPTRYTERQSNSHLETAQKILDPNAKKTSMPTSSTTSYGIYTGTTNTSGGKRYTLDDLPNDVKDRYSEVAKGLKRKGLSESDDITDNSVLSKVIEYEKTFGKRDNSVAILDDTSNAVGKYSTGTVRIDEASVLRATRKNKDIAKYKHPVTGKNYTWKQLQEDNEFKARDISLVVGYVDADNDLSQTEGKKSDSKNEWVSPQVVMVADKDGVEHRFYKTRNHSEMMSPRYQADVRLNNNIFGKTKNNPLLPQEVEVGGKQLQATYLPENQVNVILSEMQSRLLDEQGNIRPEVDAEEVNIYLNLIDTKERAGNRAGVYEFEDSDGNRQYNDKESIQKIEYLLSGITNF